METISERKEEIYGSSNDVGIGREGEGFCTEKTKIMIVEKAVTSSGTDMLYMDEEEKEVSQTSTRDNLTIIDE